MDNVGNLVNSDWLMQKNQGLSLAEENNVLQAGEGKLPGAKLDKQCKVLEQKELFCQWAKQFLSW